MRRFRQERRSSFENGGSETRFCRAKTHTSRIAFEIRKPPSTFEKKRLLLSGETSAMELSR